MDTRDEDAQQLGWLTLGHYVVGGLVGLVGCFPMIHLTVGLGMLMGSGQAAPDDQAPLRAIGAVFAAVGGLIIATFWLLAAAILFAGRSLAQRRRRTLCLVVAALECVACVPFGTILGVFTLIVLQRPSVQALFVDR